MDTEDAPPHGIGVEHIAGSGGGEGYREARRATRSGIRITYTPPRNEAGWVVLTLVAAVGLCAAFVAWLAARSGLEVQFTSPASLISMFLLGTVLTLIGRLVFHTMVRKRGACAELAADQLHCWNGDVVAREHVHTFSVERHTPRRRDPLAAVGWFVTARGPVGGPRNVLEDLPTEEHAAYVCAQLAAELMRTRNA